MRTKALLCAAIVAAGAATSMAQSNVYSLNIVGYVNVSQPGNSYRMYGNPLNQTNNDVANVLPNGASFPGLTVYKFNGVGYDITTFDPDAGGWTSPMQLNPGAGFWLQSPAGGSYSNTFVGEVKMDSTNNIPVGYSQRASVVPQSAPLQTGLGAPLTDGDTTYFFNGVGYDIYTIDPDAGGWTPSEPVPAVAQGFWIQTATAKNWIRHFTSP